jgi:hypothetical protein
MRVSIRTLSVADTQQFGILRMIVSDWQKATALLKDAGCVVKVTEVLAVEVPDRPGGLAGLLELFETSGINIEYMYAFTFGRQGRAVLIFHDKPDAATERLQTEGINAIESGHLQRRIRGKSMWAVAGQLERVPDSQDVRKRARLKAERGAENIFDFTLEIWTSIRLPGARYAGLSGDGASARSMLTCRTRDTCKRKRGRSLA